MKNRTYLFAIPIVLVVVGLIGFFVVQGGNGPYEEAAIEIETLQDIVAVTGTVEPVSRVDLAFATSGRVSEVSVDIGDEVQAGQVLARLNQPSLSADLSQAQSGVAIALANLEQAQAQLAQQQAILEELESGARTEDVELAQLDVESAEDTLEQAQETYALTVSQSQVDLQADVDAAVTAMIDAADDAKSALISLTDIQYDVFYDTSPDSSSVASAKALAVEALLDETNAGRVNKQGMSGYSEGLYGELRDLGAGEDIEAVTAYLEEAIEAIQLTYNALDAVPLTSNVSDTQITTIDTEKSVLTTSLTNLLTKQSAIDSQIAANELSVSSALLAITSAENALALAMQQLDIQEAGTRDEQIAAQEAVVASYEATITSRQASVSQAQAKVQSVVAQMGDATITAPFDGVVTERSIDIGESATSGSVAIVLMTEGAYEIAAYIPERNIGKIELGQAVDVELDAYPGVTFPAAIAEIDPAETNQDELPTYGVTIRFDDMSDDRVLAGMTANCSIIAKEVAQALSVPTYAIETVDGVVGVYVKNGEDILFNQVQIGLQSVDGRTEVLSGIDADDIIVIMP